VIRLRFARAAFVAVAFVVLSAGIADARAAGPGRAAIASAYPLASEAGHEILKRGGNAFDAAVAVSAALAVVEPYGSGLTGGGFYLLHRAQDGRQVVVDAREMAPGAATRDMYLDRDGNVIPGASTDTPLAGGIPGEPAAWAHLAEKYGRLPLSVSLGPAIRLAREGFPVYERLQAGLRFKAADMRRSPDAARIFLVKGEAPPIGYRLRQPDLARVLETVAKQGARGFYTGPLARKMVAGVRAGGGIWSEDDLARYQVIEREPVVGEYRGVRIVSIPPPSSGGVALIDSLNILSGFDLRAVDGITRKHLVIEAMRRAFRDRAEYLGDPGFAQVPVERLINPYYAAGQRASIRADRATPSSALPGIAGNPGGMHTTHFSVIDAEGNRVAGTQSLNLWFGTAWVIPGTGLLLNNTMDDFSVKAGVPNAYQLVGAAANAVAPLKRPLSSMTPSFVEAPQGLMIIGSPGGSFIISMVLLGTLNWLDGMSPADVVAAPRYHHQFLPDSLMFEPGALSVEERAGLVQRGHALSEASEPWGNLQVVTWDYASGRVEAASDPRGVGVGFVY
jgi:gamma-glutamyltranspeptidase/glutathione hydrolase